MVERVHVTFVDTFLGKPFNSNKQEGDLPKKKEIFNIFVILDGSGSMSPVQDDVVKGLNGLIDEHRKNDTKTNKAKLWFTVFDTSRINKLYEGALLEDVNPLTRADTLLGGGTPLLDAVGSTLSEAQGKKLEGKKLVVIYTDGHENSSREWTRAKVKDLIESLQKEGDWTITYMSADVDNFADAQAIGIAPGNYTFTQSATTASNLHAHATASMGLRKSSLMSTATYDQSFDVTKTIAEDAKKKRTKTL